MRDFSDTYRNIIDIIDTPELNIENIKNFEKTKKIVRKRQASVGISVFVFILLLSLFAGGTVYAMKMYKAVHMTERGYKIDNSINDEDVEKNVIIEYEVDESLQKIEKTTDANIIEQELDNDEKSDFNKEGNVVYDVSSANDIMPFSIITADVESMNLDKIFVYTPETWIEKCYISIMCYSNDYSKMEITYRYFVNDNWGYETDFGDNYVSTKTITNDYGIQFTVVEGYYSPDNKTIYEAVASFDKLVVIINAENLKEDELIKIINTMDLTDYKKACK
jgi:hypothetical protein